MFPQRFSLFIAGLLLHAAAAPAAGSKVLTPQDFQQTISDGVWFIEYFSPYCRHCRSFEPTWDSISDEFEKKQDPGIHLAQVNCALNGDLCTENGITGYPQLNLYRNGQFVEMFNQNRDFDILVNFLLARAEPSKVSLLPSPTTGQEVSTTAEVVPEDEIVVIQTSRVELNPSGEVISLTSETFDDFVAKAPTFVKFFAPWCGHCKKLAPTWIQVARRMQHRLNIAEVNCDDHKSLCSRQGVAGYPSIFYYSQGTKIEYTGGRKYEQLLTFTEKAASPKMQPISADDVAKVVGQNPVAYILLLASNDHTVSDIVKENQMLLELPPLFVLSSDFKELFTRYDIPTSIPWILLAFKDHDSRQPTATFDPSISQSPDALRGWLLANRLPTSFELSSDVFQQVMNAPHKPLVVIAATPKGTESEVSSKLNDIAKKWRLRKSYIGKKDVVFTWMDADQWGSWMKSMYGVKVKDQPKVVVADHDRLMYWDKDAARQPIQLNTVSMFSVIEGIYDNKIPAKHSRNMLERAVEVLKSSLIMTKNFLSVHPYAAGLLCCGFFAAAFWVVKSLFSVGDIEAGPGHRYLKGGRLD